MLHQLIPIFFGNIDKKLVKIDLIVSMQKGEIKKIALFSPDNKLQLTDENLTFAKRVVIEELGTRYHNFTGRIVAKFSRDANGDFEDYINFEVSSSRKYRTTGGQS